MWRRGHGASPYLDFFPFLGLDFVALDLLLVELLVLDLAIGITSIHFHFLTRTGIRPDS